LSEPVKNKNDKLLIFFVLFCSFVFMKPLKIFYKTYQIYIYLFLFISCSGTKYDEKLIFNNNSDKTLSIYEARNYPDTMQIREEIQNMDNGEHIPSRKSVHLGIAHDWEEYMKLLPSGIDMFYVVNDDTLKKFDILNIIRKNKIEKRFDLTLDDLKKSNWTITFP